MSLDINMARGVPQTPTFNDPLQQASAASATADMASLLGASGNVTVSQTAGVSGSGKTTSAVVPELDEADEAKAGKADLEALLAYLQMETDEKSAEAQSQRIKSLKGQLEAAHDSQMAKIDKSIEEAKKQEKAAKASK